MLRLSARAAKTSIVGAVALGLLVSSATAALAAKPSSGKTQPAGSGLALTSETQQWNPYVSTHSCLTEDDYDQRNFSGSLSGSYVTSYQLCDLNSDGYTAGGIGLQSQVSVVGQLSDLSITAPDGSVHHAVLMGQNTSKGVTSYSYAVCYVPLYYRSSDTSSGPLRGGTWQMALTGQISNAYWTTNAEMADVNFQQSHCPTSEQNLS